MAKRKTETKPQQFRPREPRPCVKCGKTIEKPHSWQKYCSGCSIALNRPKKYFCLYCKKLVKPIVKYSRRGVRTTILPNAFYSDSCCHAYYRTRHKIYQKFSLDQIPSELSKLKQLGKNYELDQALDELKKAIEEA